jgi:hypothetical protein
MVPCPSLLKTADSVGMQLSVERLGRIWATPCLGTDIKFDACSVGALWKMNAVTSKEMERGWDATGTAGWEQAAKKQMA